MNEIADPIDQTVVSRAMESLGRGPSAVYQAAIKVLAGQPGRPFERLADVGCGVGSFSQYCQPLCNRYTGIDAARYDAFPAEIDFLAADLDTPAWPIADATFDATVSLETIEHLENPRAFFREIARITQPGGLVIVTTPNQLSWRSKLALVLKNEFAWFQEGPGLYPAHRTALLAIDLIRIARETGLADPQIQYSDVGQIPGTATLWPGWLGGGRAFSDNVLLIARKPAR